MRKLLLASIFCWSFVASEGVLAQCGLSSIDLVATTDSMCPGDVDTLSITSVDPGASYDWFLLDDANWQTENVNGNGPIDLENNPGDTVFGAFDDGGIRVFAWLNGSWVSQTSAIPSGFSLQDLAVSPSNELYVALLSNTTSRGSVYQWSGSSWSLVDTANFTPTFPGVVDLEVAANGNVYYAFRNGSQFDQLSVIADEGTGWAYLGGTTFASPTTAWAIDLEISSLNEPVVAAQIGFQGEIYRYSGSSWSQLGSSQPNVTIERIDLEMDGNTPYFTYQDDNTNPKVYVKRYNGSVWLNVGMFDGTTNGQYPQLEVYQGDVILSYHPWDISQSGVRYLRNSGSNWFPYMSDFPFVSGSYSNDLKLDLSGFPVVKHNGDAYAYDELTFNLGVADTVQTISQPGEYLVVSSDTCGDYRRTDVLEIIASPIPSYDLLSEPVQCTGDSNGQVSVQVNGSEPILTYLWNTGAVNALVDSLPAATYTVELQGTYCLLHDTIVLPDPGPINNAFAITDQSCPDSPDGIAMPITTGGTPPFRYAIDGVARDTSSLDFLIAGTFEVHTLDAFGCAGLDTITVGLANNPAVPVINTDTFQTLCDDSLELTTPGSYTSYQWFREDTGDFEVEIANLFASTSTNSIRQIVALEEDAIYIYSGAQDRVYQNDSLINIGSNPGGWYYQANYEGGQLLGDSGNFQAFRFGWRDVDSSSWKSSPEFPVWRSGLHSYNQAYANGELYVLASEIGFNSNLDTTALWRLEPKTNTWSRDASQLFGGEFDKLSLSTGQNGHLYGFGWSKDDGYHVFKEWDGNSWTVLDSSATDVFWEDEIDFEHLDDDRFFLAERNVQAGTMEMFEYVSGSWQLIGSFDRTVFFSDFEEVKIHQDQYGLVYLSYRQAASSSQSPTYNLVHRYENNNWYSAQLSVYGIEHDLAVSSTGDIYLLGGNNLYRFGRDSIGSGSSVWVHEPGQYRLIVNDGTCDALRAKVHVVHPELALVMDTISPLICKNDDNGIAAVQVVDSTGTTNYTYNWSTGASTDTISNLAPGTYTVSVTDLDGCLRIDSLVIEEPDSLWINSVATTAPNCSGGLDGMATATTTGGWMPYTYAWPLGPITASDTFLMNTGTHQVVVIDSLGCTDTSDFTIPTGSFTVNDVEVTGNESAICGIDSVILTAQTNASQFQWFTMDSGNWDFPGDTSINNLTGGFGRVRETDVEFDEAGRFYVATSSDVGNQHVNFIHYFDGYSWNQLGTPYTPTGFYTDWASKMSMELLSQAEPVVTYIHYDSPMDTLFVKRWDGQQWQTEISLASSFWNDVDLEKGPDGKLRLLYSGTGYGADLLERNGTGGWDTLYTDLAPNISEFALSLQANSDSSWFIMAQEFNEAVLYELNGTTLDTIDSSPLAGLLDESEAFRETPDRLIVNAWNKVFIRENGNWGEIGVPEGVDADNHDFAVSPEGIPYFSQYGDVYFYNGTQWVQTRVNNQGQFNTAESDGATELKFLPDGRPVIAHFKAQLAFSTAFEIFEPTAISGETAQDYTATGWGYLMVEAADGSCVKNRTTLAEAAQLLVTGNDSLTCPEDVTNVSALAVGFGDSVTYSWNTGDTTSLLQNVNGGTYYVTVSGTTCSALDSVFIGQTPTPTITIDSLADASCNGVSDGFVSVDVQSVNGYTYGWTDLLGSNSGSTSTVTRDNLAGGTFGLIINMNQCSWDDTLSIVINEPAAVPEPTLNGSTVQSLCTGDSVLLSATPSGGAQVQWMSYDSIDWQLRPSPTNFVDREQAVVERDGKLYRADAAPDPNGGITLGLYELKGSSWQLVWIDTVKASNPYALAVDDNDNFIIGSHHYTGSEWFYRVQRLGIDTTLLFDLDVTYFVDRVHLPNLRIFQDTIVLAYANEYDELIVNRFDGNTLDTLNVNVTAQDNRFLNLEIDTSGTYWFGLRDFGGSRLYRYDGSAMNLEHTFNSSLQEAVRIHTMPDGSVWCSADYGFSFNPDFYILRYVSNQWDTITARHPQMSTVDEGHDLSHDPMGNPILLDEENVYVWNGLEWILKGSGFTTLTRPFFEERSCGYSSALDYWGEVYESFPATNVGSANSIYVQEGGIYKPVGDLAGCLTYAACPVTVDSGFVLQLDVLDSVACGGDSTAHLQLNAVGVDLLTANILWNTGDTVSTLDSLPTGTYSVTVTNNQGCSRTASVTLAAPPAIQVQLTQLVQNDCGGNSNGSVEVSVSGGTGALSVLWSTGGTDTLLSNLSGGTYTVTVTDNNGCSTDTAFTITSSDTIPPNLNAQDDTIYLDVNGNYTLTVFDFDPGLSDNCGIASASVFPSALTCAYVGSNTIYLDVTDSAGNQSLDTVTAIVLDTFAPTVFTNALTPAYLDSNGQVSLTTFSVDSATFDNCGLASLQLSQTLFGCADTGMVSALFTATDVNGNSSSTSVSIQVLDTLAPAINPIPIDLYLDPQGMTQLDTSSLASMVTDNCALDSVWVTQVDFNCQDAGLNAVMIYASDVSGNMDSAAWSVTVIDTIAPQALAIAVLNVSLDSTGQIALQPAMIDSGSTDDCGIATYSLSIDTITCANIGSGTLTFTVTDFSGNSDSTTVQLLVQDTLPPIILAQNVVLPLDSFGNASLTLAQVDSGSFDGCAIASQTLSQTSFNCGDLGVNLVTYTVSDVNGNIDSVTIQVDVQDTLDPVTQLLTVDTLYLDALGSAATVAANYDLGSTDNCGSVTLALNQSLFGCSDLGLNSVPMTVSDQAGNTVQATIDIWVLDTIAPQALAVSVLNVSLDSTGQAILQPLMVDSGSNDNCGIETYSLSIDTLTCTNIGSGMLTLTVTDSAGNIDSTTIQLLVQDTLPPVIQAQNVVLLLDSFGNATLTVGQVDSGSFDDCAITSQTLSQTNFSCADLGINSVMYTVTDVNGNSDSVTIQVDVQDTLDPVAQLLTVDTLYLTSFGSVSATAANYDLGSTDNCGPVTLALNQTLFGCNDVGLNSVSITASDQAGNSVQATIDIWVLDTLQPIVNCPGDTELCEGAYSFTELTYSDNCSATLTQFSGQPAGTILNQGSYTYTFRIEDPSGNFQNCSWSVEVFEDPVVSLGNDTSIISGESLTYNAGPASWQYLWSTGDTTNSVTIAPVVSGPLAVTVTNGPCSVSDEIFITVDSNTSVGDQPIVDWSVNLFPNPTDGEFTLELSKWTPGEVSITVLDKYGRLIEQRTGPAQKRHVINLSQEAQGVYYVMYRAGDVVRTLPVAVF